MNIKRLILVALCRQEVVSFIFPASTPTGRIPLHARYAVQNEVQQRHGTYERSFSDSRRREIVLSLASFLTISSFTQPSYATDGFDDGQSGLSRIIRRTAVRGAQVIDKIDGKWERFSDDFGLGESRNAPKVDRLNKIVSGGARSTSSGNQPQFNEKLASKLLQECDLVSICTE